MESSKPLPETIHVFLDELPWDLRSRNTDWRYVRYVLPQLAKYDPKLRLITQRSRAVTVRGNVQTIRAALGRRLGFPLSPQQLITSTLDRRELDASGADLVFAHRSFPLNAGGFPVVWQNAVLDPAMQRNYGATEADIAEEIALKKPFYARAAAVQVSTHAEALRHAKLFPELADRFSAVPFFTPDVHPCELSALERQRDTDPVRILFVGNHALRKGLDLLLEAFLQLAPSLQARARLTVISNFDRSSMKLPQHEGITYVRGMSHQDVIAEMLHSHILVNVARFESYGLVFVEAMAQGTVCVGPDWEVQRELFDDGRAGVNLPCTSGAIHEALERLIADSDLRHQLALAAWTRFNDRYAPAVTASLYADLFRHVAR